MTTTGPVMTVTDELLAELDEAAREAHIARSGNDWFSQDDCCWWTGNADEGDFISAASPKAITALTAELRRLRAENAELAKDAGRLEWMVTEGAVIARMNGTGRPMCYQVSFPFESCQQIDWFPSWREAVDDIMATQ